MMYVCMYVWMDGWMYVFMYVCMYVRMYVRMDGWMDGWMCGIYTYVRVHMHTAEIQRLPWGDHRLVLQDIGSWQLSMYGALGYCCVV